MQTYIKRLVSENGIPEDGEYDTDLGKIEVFCEKWVSDEEPEYYYEETTTPNDAVSKELLKWMESDANTIPVENTNQRAIYLYKLKDKILSISKK